jgi:hypothetical protein
MPTKRIPTPYKPKVKVKRRHKTTKEVRAHQASHESFSIGEQIGPGWHDWKRPLTPRTKAKPAGGLIPAIKKKVKAAKLPKVTKRRIPR